MFGIEGDGYRGSHGGKQFSGVYPQEILFIAHIRCFFLIGLKPCVGTQYDNRGVPVTKYGAIQQVLVR